MDLEQRVKQLEGYHDWQGVVETLEQGVLTTNDAAKKAEYHLKLGRLLFAQFIQGVRALKHFQDAYKLNPAYVGALSEARSIYWELGKLNMVQKLLELELKNSQDADAKARLSVELGDVLADLGDYDRAREAYSRAVSSPLGSDAKVRLQDLSVSDETWSARAEELVQQADQAERSAQTTFLLRAARIARRFAPGEVEGLLAQAYRANPADPNVAALYEALLVDAEQTDLIAQTQKEVLKGVSDPREHAALAYRLGVRWTLKHQESELGAELLETALRSDPSREEAFTYLRDLHGARAGEWEKVIRLADELSDRSNLGPQGAYLLALGGLMAWKERGDLMLAKRFFQRLARVDPDHAALLLFEAQISEKLSAPSSPPESASSRTQQKPAAEPPSTPPSVSAPLPSSSPTQTASSAKSSSAPPGGSSGQNDLEIAELREKLSHQETAKRYHEYVKTLLALGDALTDPVERETRYLEAAELYVSRFSNQSEAVKAYEKVLDVNPENQAAVAYLREMYEKRRDWEKLVQLGIREAELLPSGPARAHKFKDIAALATERVKKPDVCIDLWRVVLDNEPEDLDALNALSLLYDRSRDYERLADVLSTLSEITYDADQKAELLGKLGQVAGDRLKDDERAIEAYRALLTLHPNDRRAQEQLKRRYVALGRWDDLEVFYSDTGKWDEFIRVLESNETRATDTAQRVAMLMKIAELWMTQKGKADRAARSYEKVLTLDPENRDAAEHLIPIYASTNNSKGLSAAIEVKLGHLTDPDERLELLRELAGLYESRVNDKSKAFARYLDAFALAPGDEQGQLDLERAARATGSWGEVISAYRSSIASAESEADPATAILLRLRLGRVLVEEGGKIDEALKEYRAVHALEPENTVALSALEGLYHRTEGWSDLLGVYSRKRELAQDAEERRAILLQIAALYDEKLGDLRSAIETYDAILSDFPADAGALEALDRLYRATEQWVNYAQVIRTRIELEGNDRVIIDLKFRLAETYHKLGDDRAALESYREILFIDADHSGALQQLELLLSNQELRGEAARILENVYEAREEWEKLIHALEILASTEEPEARVVLLRKIATVLGTRLNATDRALEAQARALKEDPSVAASQIELEAIASRTGAWDQLVRIYRDVARSLTEPTLARDYWMRLAAIQEQLGKVEEAASAYEHVLSLDPADADALGAMETLYTRTQHWDQLIGVFQRRIELSQSDQERETLHVQMAQVFEHNLGKSDEAIEAYREVLALNPTNPVALSALDGLLGAQGLWEELAENLETQLGLTSNEHEQLSLMLRLASLREREMKQPEAAIEGYRLVLERDPVNAQALGALERLGQTEGNALSIAEILEPLYRSQGDYQKLIRVYEIQVDRTEDAQRKVDLLHEIASLYEDATSNLNAAFDVMARALAVDPASEATQQSIDRLARATGRHQDVAAVFERLAQEQHDVEIGSALYAAAARVYEVDVQDPERAVELYRKVIAIDPGNLGATEALENLFHGSGRYAEMSEVLQLKAEVLENVDSKKQALFQAASLEEEVLNRPDQAIRVYLSVLEVDAEDQRSIDALIKLYLGSARWEELLGVYSRKADLVFDPEQKKLILYQVGAVYERELSDVSRAIDTYQRVLELDPDDLAALGRLDVLYQEAKNWQDLLSVLQHEAELTSDPLEAVSYQYRIADTYEKHLGEVDHAVELYREILGIVPDHPPTLSALEAIKAGSQSPLAAATVLEPIYEASGAWAPLINVLEVRVRFTEDEFSKVDLLHRIAFLYEENLGDPSRAFEIYARAVSVDSQNEDTLGALERLARVIDHWPVVAELYDAEFARLEEDGHSARAVELGLRLAQVYEVQLENLDEAVSRYQKVLAIDTENQSAVRALDRLFAQSERWEDLAEVLTREADISESPDEILELKYRLGQVHQLKLKDLDRAVSAYREVISAAPEHGEALHALEMLFEGGAKQSEIGEILEPLYHATSKWERLIRVREAQLERLEDPALRLQMYHRIAEDAEERLFDPVAAFNVHVRAIKENPLDERSGEELERLASTLDGGWEQLANAYADVLSVEDVEVETQAAIGKRLARVFEEELVDVAKAEETYRYVLTVAPGEPDSLFNLDRIYSSLEQWADVAGVLEQRAAVTEDEGEKTEIYARLGQIYEEHSGQVDDAIRAYRAIFDRLDPSNEQAIGALARIYAQTERYEELGKVYERELDNAVGDVQEAEIRAKLAHLAAEKLGNVEAAVDGWKRVLDLRGEDSEALGALAELYERKGMWGELTDVLERHFEIAESGEDRVNVLIRRARLFVEQLNRDDEALDTWQRVLDIDFSNVVALRAVARIWRVRQDPGELASALHATIDRARGLLEPAELSEVYRELGKLYGGPLGQPYEAADAWRQLLEVSPSDFEAMAELEKIYREDARWSELVAVKMARAEALSEPEDKVRELLEVTEIWRKDAGDPDQAVAAYAEILRVDPAHEDAFDALERLHTGAQRWESLIELYLNRLESRESATQRSELLRRIARVFDERLDDKNQAFDALVNALAEDFADDETSRYLERMAQATGRWAELINTTNAWLAEQTENKKKIQLYLRLGKWYGEDLGRPDYAQPYYQQISLLDPNNVQVLRQIAGIHRTRGAFKEMGETLMRALDVAVVNDERRAVLVELGDLAAKHLGQVDQGISHYQRALDIDPFYAPALSALERIYEERKQYLDLAEILANKVKALGSSEQTGLYQLKLANLYETHLNNPERAGKVYREALESDSRNLTALRGLERICERTGDWPELVGILQRRLDVVETERERVEILVKLAQVQEEQFLKFDVAARLFEQAAEISPGEERAYLGLQRCYRRLKQWADLVGAYERHLGETTSNTTRIELNAQIAQVYADELGETDRAIDAYRSLIDLDASNIPGLEALGRLYERQGNTAEAIEAMTRVADLTSDIKQRVDMYYRLGKALDERLQDRGQAQERFEMALDLDPVHLPSLAALRGIAIEESDWDRAARYLEQEQLNTNTPRARARLLVELGKLRDEKLLEHELAVQAYELAIQCDQDCEEAAQPLVEEYSRVGRWKDAEPLAETLVRKSRNRDRGEQIALHKLQGKVLSALGKYDQALKAYQTANQLDLTDQESIRGIADASFRLADWTTALANYQKVLTALGEEEIEDRTDVYYRLGCIKHEQNQARQAINNFEKALALQSDHRPTLNGLVQVYEKGEDWQQVAAYKRQILDGVNEADERFQILNEIADVWLEREKNPQKAIDAFEEALEIKPKDHVLLHKLLQAYQAAASWQKMVELLESIALLDDKPEIRSRYLFTQAQICRDKLQDLDRAVELFNRALDLNPDYLEAFERINKILTQAKNWKSLERSYRKMIHRVAGKGNHDLEHNLWHQLGLIYRDRLQETDSAIEAFRMAAVSKPGVELVHQILAELHEAREGWDDAIAEQRVILTLDPLKVDPYRALYRLYLQRRSYDEAWCLAAAIAFMKKSDPEETRFFEDYKPQGMLAVKGRLTNELWIKHILHTEENPYVSKIFEMIAPAALQAKIAQLQAQGKSPVLDRRWFQDPATSTITFSKTFGWVAQVLGLQPPELYVRNDQPGAIVAVPRVPRASLAGQTVLSGFSPQELAFLCGKHLAVYRGEHYIRSLFQTPAELTIMLFAGIALAQPSTPMPPEMAAQISGTAQQLARYLQSEPVQVEGLKMVVKRFIEDGAKVNVRRWNQAVELSAARAGFVTCGDLETARKILSAEPQLPGDPSAADKMKDLLLYSVSQDYFEIRRALGVQIPV